MKIYVLDHGYVRFVEAWGHGDEGLDTDYGVVIKEDMECGIIEAARQSTQGSFRSWEPYRACERCGAYVLTGSGASRKGDGTCADDTHHRWREFPRGDEGLLSFLFCNKPPHATPLEFSGMTAEVQAPIFVFREWHRHRTQSYNEMSARYAPLPDLNYVPSVARLMANVPGRNKQAAPIAGADALTEHEARNYAQSLVAHYVHCETLYQRALSAGIPKELARIHLPVGRYSRMRASANLRNWLAFLTLRLDEGAQWEIRQYAAAVAEIVAEKFPRTWELFCK